MRHLSYWLIAFSLLIIVPAQASKRKVHTIGDSTMSEYKPTATPKRGWGMYLQAFFHPDSVEVNNRGKSGASTRTFYETENLWPSVKQQMRWGDYLIIQFAHNDEKCKGEDVYQKNRELAAAGQDTLTDMRGTEPNTTYKDYLRRYVNEAREMGVKPILMSPICRAYFQKDGTINAEGRHDLSKVGEQGFIINKNYVRAMREVAEEMGVPFLDMTTESKNAFEYQGKDYCMAHYFNCGDKTHTSGEGGMAVAMLAYDLLNHCSKLQEMKSWLVWPDKEECEAYIARIEDAGKQAAFAAEGMSFSTTVRSVQILNMWGTKDGYLPVGLEWPAGEIDEVANRYIEYSLSAPKKHALVVESITMPVKAKGGAGMNIHINYGFGDAFRDVTTIYENTALPNGKQMAIEMTQPILVPAGETLKIRILPWYDSNGRPQTKKYIQIGEMKVSGKRLK